MNDNGRDKRSVRRSRWRARAGGARATTHGAEERGGAQARLMQARGGGYHITGHKWQDAYSIFVKAATIL